MRLPLIRGVIDRRILANYRVDPEVLAECLPSPFRPKTVNGFGIAGICLIRLKQIRPRFVPSLFGIASENAAHRVAVEWEADGQLHTGVYIPRRDTSSWLNSMAGGRVFPGEHHRARFEVEESGDRFHVAVNSIDGSSHFLVDAKRSAEFPPDSVFSTLDDVSRFFEAGSLGYSPACGNQHFDGLELRSFNWQVEPLLIERIESSFFEDESQFPPGSVSFDNALLMQGIDHEWHSRESISCPN